MFRFIIIGVSLAVSPLAVSATLPSRGAQEAVYLARFDGKGSGSSFEFIEDEDPVMGSESWGNWSVNATAGVGTLQGVVTVVDRPAVSWVRASPGFIKTGANGVFPDASDVVSVGGGGERAAHVVVECRSWTNYTGFRVAIAAGARFPMYACRGGGVVPFSRGCYKAELPVPQATSSNEAFQRVRVPLAYFTDAWSPAQGGKTRKQCGEGVESANCLTAGLLAAIQRVEVVAEGETGDVKLEIKSISVQGGGSGTPVQADTSDKEKSGSEEMILM